MDIERLRIELAEAKRNANELSNKFVQICDQIRTHEKQMQVMRDKLWLTEGALKKENKNHFGLYRLITMYCNGEKTLDQLKHELRSRSPLLLK